jgi:hypothetical protein
MKLTNYNEKTGPRANSPAVELEYDRSSSEVSQPSGCPAVGSVKARFIHCEPGQMWGRAYCMEMTADEAERLGADLTRAAQSLREMLAKRAGE